MEVITRVLPRPSDARPPLALDPRLVVLGLALLLVLLSSALGARRPTRR